MKARVKATGEIVDVVFESSYVKDGVKVSLWTDGKKEYSKDSLNFNDSDMLSEQRMRYELIKLIIPPYMRNERRAFDSNSQIAYSIVDIVDEIIKQLKETEE